MIFSKKALLALLIAPSALVLAQNKKFENVGKKSNLKGGRNVPVRPNNDEGNRHLAAVDFPNPCMDLPADRAGWTLAMSGNDDGSTGSLPLSFAFNLYGQSYNALYINNNGNLSFNGPYSTYTAAGFPFSGVAMLAPFWADVITAGTSTSGASRGSVWRQAIGSNKFAVAWDHVDYYGGFNDNKRNTFQVIISDGNDTSMGVGNNVCFCYEDMQWTAGTVNGGIGGLGGSPATVGVNKGNGVNFFQIGRFNQAGTAYDGAYGSNDGVDYLDMQSFCFQANNNNIPPIATNVPENNRIDLACGESITNLPIVFMAPEVNQGVTITASGATAGLTVVTSQLNSQATATINWTPTSAATVNLVLTASDGVATTPVSLTFTSPGPCCQGTTAEIWNPVTDALVQPLLNGSTYCLTKYNLRAVTCDNTPPVFMKLWNTGVNGTTVRRQTENEPPFFLWGNIINATGYNDVQPSPNKQLPNGNYALRINATNPNAYAELHFTQSCAPP